MKVRATYRGTYADGAPPIMVAGRLLTDSESIDVEAAELLKAIADDKEVLFDVEPTPEHLRSLREGSKTTITAHMDELALKLEARGISVDPRIGGTEHVIVEDDEGGLRAVPRHQADRKRMKRVEVFTP